MGRGWSDAAPTTSVTDYGAGCYADCASIVGGGGGGYEYPSTVIAVEKKLYNALSVIDH
jgi:hypothetical protein